MFTDDAWDVVQMGYRPPGNDLARLPRTGDERVATPAVSGGASWTP
jgi:hypothetical protein